jgi:uncharacterized protein involved in exopolysaccharide biosynthesis
MEITKCWRIILAYKWMIIFLSLSALITSISLTYILPEKYDSIAIVLVRPQEKMKFAPDEGGKEALNFPISQLAPFDAASKTYIEVIKSRSVVEKIVHALELDKHETIQSENFYKESSKHFKEKATRYISRILQILKYGRTESVDPFTRAVEKVQKNLSLRTTKDTYIFEITSTSTEPREAAAIANTAAEIFIDYMLDAKKKESLGRRLSLASQLRESERDLGESRLALEQFKKKHRTFSLPEEYSGKLKIINELEADLEKSEVKLAGLLYTYTPSHPAVLAVMAEKDRLMQSLVELKKQVDNHPAKEKQLEDLRLRVKMAEEAYAFINKANEEIHIQEANNSSEIRIVSRAVPPTYPSGPIKIYYALAGLSTAMVFAVMFAFFLEFQAMRLRSIEDVKVALQLPILSTIPVMKPCLISPTDLRKLPHGHRRKLVSVGMVMFLAFLTPDWSWKHPSREDPGHPQVQPTVRTVRWQQSYLSYQHPAGEQFTFPLPNLERSPEGVTVEITLDTSSDRPSWLQFDRERLYIHGTAPITAENRTYDLIFRAQAEHGGESRLPLYLTIRGQPEPAPPSISTEVPPSRPPQQSEPAPSDRATKRGCLLKILKGEPC